MKLSPYAKTFYLEWLLKPDSYRYNLLLVDQNLHGTLNIETLKKALNRYISDHVLLNSHICESHGEPCWVENDHVNPLDYSENPVSKADLLNYVRRPFNLSKEPLYRFKLVRLEDDIHRLIIVFHHVLIDGLSVDTGLIDSISNYYNNENYKAKYSIEYQINMITALEQNLSFNLDENRTKHKDFWQEKLGHIENVNLLFLKSDNIYNNEIATDNSNGIIDFSFDFLVKTKLDKLKEQYFITPYIYGQCILAILLNKYTSQEQFSIAFPIAIKEGVDFIYGSQINTTFITYQFDGIKTTKDLLLESRDFFTLIKENPTKYNYYPISELMQGMNRYILNVSFHQTHFRKSLLKLTGLTGSEPSCELMIDSLTQDNLLFEAEMGNNKLNYRVRYDRRYINDILLNNFINSYKNLYLEILDDLVSGKDNKRVIDYSILDKAQYHRIMHQFNRTSMDYSQNQTIHQLFEEQVEKTPDNIAILCENRKITYRQLNAKANQLANHLQRFYNVRQESLVAICLDSSEKVIIAIMAVLKAGGAYVPLDPSYPKDRLKYVIKDAEAEVILTLQKYYDQLHQDKKNVLALDDKNVEVIISKENPENLLGTIENHCLAYVIYTSGTTGNPKGGMIEHQSYVATIEGIKNLYYPEKPTITTYSLTNYTFDIFGLEFGLPLLSGGTVILGNNEFKSLDCSNIDFIQMTPSLYDTKLESLKNTSRLTLFVGGENLKSQLLTRMLKHAPAVVNFYGPTETTIWSTAQYYRAQDSMDLSGVSIGKPLHNEHVYVLNSYLQPMPIGAIGELYIGGVGLARGYLNRPELTEERFIGNPFQTIEERTQGINSRIYKTGDLVRWLTDGRLEYIGRNDFQVKIRGYRIELSEIENTLLSYPGIKKAIILAKEQFSTFSKTLNNKVLVAYYVANSLLDGDSIQKYLAKKLPDFMRPNILVYLKEVPLTINGKLDTKALPEAILERPNKYRKPSNEQEKLICQTFSDVLGIGIVGVDDDFFKLGGNSLTAIKLTSMLQIYFDVKVSDIFNFCTPQRIAQNVFFGTNVLAETLCKLKEFYKKQSHQKIVAPSSNEENLMNYFRSINDSKTVSFSLKNNTSHILLTGSTGYLGCNLLNQLLRLTDYKIYLLVRADSKLTAIDRVKKKFSFYFNQNLDVFLNRRVFVINGDIEQTNLGLSIEDYESLVMRIDSIIHAAALVKHIGDQHQFYSANVRATIYLLEMAKHTRTKDFHYISTLSVLDSKSVPSYDEAIYTEDDSPEKLTEPDNIYIKTKLQAEQEVVHYRTYGINSNIYRVGNLAFISENFRPQENIEENAFFNWLKYLATIKCIPREISIVEISQVDLTARAIVHLFDKKQLTNQIFHVFNPHLVNLETNFAQRAAMNIKVLPMKKFIAQIEKNLLKCNNHELLLRFLFHQGWLEGRHNTTAPQILQERTSQILKQLNFEWPLISATIFDSYMDSLPLSHDTKEVV